MEKLVYLVYAENDGSFTNLIAIFLDYSAVIEFVATSDIKLDVVSDSWELWLK